MKHPMQLLLVLALCLGWTSAFATATPSTASPNTATPNTATSAIITTYVEGQHYQRAPQNIVEDALVQDLLKEAKDKVQVIEFFSYGCHWCYKLDPFMEKWEKTEPSFVSFQRIPVEFQPAWSLLSKAYYTEVELGIIDKVHVPLFEAIQTEKVREDSEEALKKFFVSKGVKEEDFIKTFNSFAVTRKQKWANKISLAYHINAIPTVIVQGPAGVFVTTVKMAGSQEAISGIIDFLVKREREALISSSKGENAAKNNKQ